MSIHLHHADMLKWLAAYDGPLFDSCVTDPPYHLTSIVRRWSGDNARAWEGGDGLYQRATRGFMGKTWDGGDIAQRPETWRAVYDRLKPGAHLVAFAATRTYHRMACAIEDAGFEIRDMPLGLYGSGFPKSHNQKGEWEGWGTALKPALEPICLARKPLDGTVAANLAEHGTGALNIDGCRVATTPADARDVGRVINRNVRQDRDWGMNRNGSDVVASVVPAEGRWPANVIHDGSDEVVALFPADAKAGSPVKGNEPSSVTSGIYGEFNGRTAYEGHADSGSAARFFYSAKAGPLDRLGSKHATVKPVDLMRWLVRLITPPGGHVLEPFAGSGTTGIACMAEGFDCTMLELEADHHADIERKLAVLRGEGRMKFIEHDRRHEERKSSQDFGPLFDGGAA